MNNYIPGYGYLQVTPDDTKFIKVSNWRSFEGKGGKHRRNKKTYKRKINSCKKSRKNTRK